MRESFYDRCMRTGNTELLSQWVERNAPLTPQTVSYGSKKKLWWRCKEGHSWQAAVYTRSGGSGCPYCAGKAIQIGDNDLATRYPEVAKEWDAVKNAPLTPANVAPHTHRKVWWRCARGHEWQATIHARTQGDGCPVCSNRIPVVGENTLTDRFPQIAQEWDYEKNAPVTPEQVLPGTSRRFWWICSKGHSYRTNVSSRTSGGSSCPICSGQAVLAGENDLQTLFPEIAAQWDHEKNIGCTPDSVTASSNRRVWWRCELGHSFCASIAHRVRYRSGCPYCTNKKVLPGFNDLATVMLGTDYEIVSGNKGTNADDYTLTIQGKGGYNGTATKGWTILKADQTAPTVGKTDETIRGKADGTISSLTTAMEYRAKNSQTYTKAQTDGTLKNLAAGTYYVRYAETDNYKASEDAVVAIGEGRLLTITLPVENEQVGYTLTANSTQVRYNDGTVIRIVLDSGYTRGDSFRVTATNGTVTLVGGAYYLQNVTEDTVVTVEGIVDSTAPTAEITVKGNSWSKFVDKITFGLFFNETQDVTITANDAGSGVDRIYYYLSDTPLTLEQVKALADTNWTEYAGKFSISAEQKYVVYAKVTDNWGNATYISSDGLILDMTAPVISGVENGKTYYTTQKVTANDTNLKELTLDGVAFDGTIPGNVDKVYTITAKDKAGNSTTFSITMKPISSIREGLPTMDTVKISDKDAIEDVRATASNVLASQCANATDEEKNQLEQIITDCDTLLEAIQNAEDAIELIAAMPDAKKTQPDDKTAIDAYEAAKAAYDKLTDAEKRMVGNENKAKLDAMYEALTAYDITKGDGSTWTKGSTSGLSFTANGYFGKFTGIKVDGETVDAKYYEAQSGSTVITLKASYLQTLKTGKHTIQVVYTDGATDGTDTFTIKAAGTTGGNSTTNGVNSPATGDHSHMALWISLLCVSAVGMIAVLLVRRKKGRYER